jgi:hypothetical protein
MKIALILSLLLSATCLAADKLDEKIVDKLADAVYKIEGGEMAKQPYGILSVEVKGKTRQEKEMYARQICKTTIRKNFLRWQKAGKEGEFLDFLANRYVPIVSDRQGNINWKKNIRKVSGLDF